MGLFNLALYLNGFPMKKANAALHKILAVPDADFPMHVESQKRFIASHHLQNNSFYREIAAQDQFDSWEALPVMKKSDFQRPLLQRLSSGYSESNVFINKTSGSSGDPMVFAKDKMCHAMVWSNIIRRFKWYGMDLNNSWQARFYGRSLDAVDGWKIRIKDYMSKRHRFDIFDLSDASLEKMLEKFRTKKFEYLNGYTSSIVQLAKYLDRKNQTLKSICPSLKVCITTSEMLFDSDRELLERVFGIPVVNEYGASELDIIAFENPDGEWIVNSETLFVEILDENDRAVPNGQEGRIVVTALQNLAHPFIRYEVGDYGILDARSTAKKPLLKKLIGRTNDIAVLPSGKKAAGMTFYSITKKLFDDDTKVREFVISQTHLDTFEIDYAADEELNPEEITRIESIMTQYLEPGLHFKFTRFDSIPRNSGGKLKQFRNLVQ